MNNTEKKYAVEIARIMRAARKHRNFTQIEVSKRLGISQGTLSKIESGSLIMSTPLWFEACEAFKISTRAFLLGYLDFPNPHLESQGGFQLNKKYSDAAATSVRDLRGLLTFASSALGPSKMNALFRSLKVDADFFSVLTNRINLQFTYDLIKALESKINLNQSYLQKISAPYSDPLFHGTLSGNFSNKNNGTKNLEALIQNMDGYQSNFNFKVERQGTSLLINGEPANFVKRFGTDERVKLTTCTLRAKMFASVYKISGKYPKSVQHSDCYHKGDALCRFVIHS